MLYFCAFPCIHTVIHPQPVEQDWFNRNNRYAAYGVAAKSIVCLGAAREQLMMGIDSAWSENPAEAGSVPCTGFVFVAFYESLSFI